jgi:hypothetical protein
MKNRRRVVFVDEQKSTKKQNMIISKKDKAITRADISLARAVEGNRG